MIEVLKPGRQRLAVPSDVARELGCDEATAAALVARATLGISRWCVRTFGIETVVETEAVDRWTNVIFCSRWPIVQVHHIIAGHVLVPAKAYEVDPEHGTIYYLVRTPQGGPPAWRRTEISVAYEGGFVLPGEPGRNLPEDIEAACRTLAAILHRAGGEPIQGMPRPVQELLRAYRQPSPLPEAQTGEAA